MIESSPVASCAVCSRAFVRRNTMHNVCLRCAVRTLRAETAALKRQDRERKEALKPRRKWLQEAQAAFNAWVRERDAKMPCVSCGRHHEGQWHAGHYMSTGARPELRFDEANIHKQCQPCNTHLHGNLVMYRAELIRRIGIREVLRLEGPNAPKKYTVDQLRAIRDDYRARLKAMKEQA